MDYNLRKQQFEKLFVRTSWRTAFKAFHIRLHFKLSIRIFKLYQNIIFVSPLCTACTHWPNSQATNSRATVLWTWTHSNPRMSEEVSQQFTRVPPISLTVSFQLTSPYRLLPFITRHIPTLLQQLCHRALQQPILSWNPSDLCRDVHSPLRSRNWVRKWTSGAQRTATTCPITALGASAVVPKAFNQIKCSVLLC